VVFKGGILGGVRQFWGNPYLNSATVLFDIHPNHQLCIPYLVAASHDNLMLVVKD